MADGPIFHGTALLQGVEPLPGGRRRGLDEIYCSLCWIADIADTVSLLRRGFCGSVASYQVALHGVGNLGGQQRDGRLVRISVQLGARLTRSALPGCKTSI